MVIRQLHMAEAAGVEPLQGTDDTQVVDFRERIECQIDCTNVVQNSFDRVAQLDSRWTLV